MSKEAVNALISLGDCVSAELERQSPVALGVLCDRIRARLADSVVAIVFYGSCLRSGDPYEGIVDLHVVVDSYRQAYGSGLMAMANRVLPPNVFFTTVPDESGVIRCKYNVVSLEHLRRLTSRHTLHSFFWARLAQPSVLLWVRDDRARDEVVDIVSRAVIRFLASVRPLVEPTANTADIWRTGLMLAIGSELRAESARRADVLLAAGEGWFERLTPPALAVLGDPWPTTPGARRAARFQWRCRGLWGKLLSLLRLVKGWFTFDGGLDYVVWKLERHSGRRIEVPERVRRFPWLFLPAFAWRLYRQGIFR